MSKVITLEDLKAYVPSTTTVDDDRGQQVVDAVNQWIENRTNRIWGETKQVTERYDWGSSLYLRHMDVDTSTVVIKAGWPGQTQQTIASNAYIVGKYGRITMIGQLWFGGLGQNSRYYNDYLEITYQSGNISVPDDLKLAALGVAAGFYNWAINGGRDIAAVAVGSYQITYTNKRQSSSGTPDQATSTGDANWSVIESYRQRRM